RTDRHRGPLLLDPGRAALGRARRQAPRPAPARPGQKLSATAPARRRPGRSQARASCGLRPCPAAARRPPWRRPERPGRCSMTTEPFVRTFGLTDLPFSKEIPDSELWLPPSKQALVDELCEAVEQRAQVLLVGEPGVGKTCVLRALRHRLPPPQF